MNGPLAAKPLRIAIDGPSGSGKSTLGRGVARHLGLPYVDTGAMYRAAAWAVTRAGAESEAAILDVVLSLELTVVADPADFRVIIDGEDVTSHLRDPEVSKMAARVASIEGVRRWIVPKQIAAAQHGAVVEGRDIGTVVIPDADFKFFVTSDEATRMARRAAQLGLDSTGAKVVQDVRERDRLDRTREHSPLRAAADAVVIDTGGQTPDESLATILEVIGAG